MKKLLGQRTGEGVGAPARGERDDQRDGTLGPLRGGDAAETQGGHGEHGRGGLAICHVVSSLLHHGDGAVLCVSSLEILME
ncbi:hypothetical protein G6F22_017145 [Rhizopus arrhizus]|nr:hypothetical protein G6F22_017145 [Rhizopus arrhizus]